MAQKPSIPKGTRDFSPEEVAKRNYIFNCIQTEFKRFGFQPIETPSFENSSTLMGKYGDEGDRLIFKILNSGDYLSNFNQTLLEFIKEMIFHFNNVSEKQVQKNFDSKTEAKFFIESFNERLKEVNNKRFNDEKFPKKHFIDDLTFIIQKNSQEYLNFENLAKTKPELATSIIFSDFYYRLNPNILSGYISEKALRYDLTVPFARYVVQHQNEIEFPFKRYQMQPVWRADRPQKGRFREFYQCDADVVGSNSLWQEVEFIQLYDSVFNNLGLEGVTIKINNRKVLSGFAEVIGEQDKLIDFTVALDKLDKIGEEGVKKEMREKGISEEALQKIQPIFNLQGSFAEKIQGLSSILKGSETGQKGIEELQFIQNAIQEMPLKTAKLDLDVTLARGLNYYTGAIFEVAAPEKVKMGSIGGGGRYDDLTGIFGLKDMSGIGISFGLDRIYLVLEELELFPATVTENTKVLFINFGEKEALYAMKAVQKLRSENITAELYPDSAKMGKQMKYADKRQIPYVVLAGEEEMNNQKFTLKHMKSGEQSSLEFNGLKNKLSNQ